MKKSIENWSIVRFFIQSKNIGALLAKIVLLLIIPYAYLMLCGLVFDYLLKWYFMTTTIFVTLLVIFVIAILLIVWAVIRYINKDKINVDNTDKETTTKKQSSALLKLIARIVIYFRKKDQK